MKKYLLSTIAFINIFSSVLIAQDYFEEEFGENPFYLSIDYLFWQALSDQSQYALKSPGGLSGDGFITTPKTFIENQKFKWGSGVRLKGGHLFCNNLDLGFTWTHFKKKSSTNVSGVGEIAGTALFGIIDQTVINEASSQWTVKFDTFDLECAYIEYLCDFLALRPFIGIRGARINQFPSIIYPGFTGDLIQINVQRKNNFWGIGPRVGIDAKLFFWDGLHIISNASGALLFGKFDSTLHYEAITDTRIFDSRFIENKHRLRPTAQLMLGLGWERPICNVILEIAVGYEAQYWWNQMQTLPNAISFFAIPSGDLMLHGLVAHIGVWF